MFPALETERLLLTPRAASDNADLQPLFSDWEIIKNLTDIVPWPYPDDGMETYWRDTLGPDLAAGKERAWALRLKSAPEKAIGQINLRAPGAEDQRGFWLGRPYWGRGLMQEAAEAVTAYAFNVLGYEKMVIPTRHDNHASNRIKEKQGFRLIKQITKRYAGGDEHMSLLWELSRDAYRLGK